MQEAPEDDGALPETIDESQDQPEGSLKTFRDLGIAEPICEALEAAGITATFPIQALALPIALDGHDLIGQARTGTGKTLAFGAPLLQRLDATPGGRRSAPRALVVVPTRELAIQVADDLRMASARMDIKVVTVYGGRAYEPQIEAIATGDLVVGTPGRLLDLIRQGHLDLSEVHGLVLDEADKMLDLGFLPDVEKILRLTPPQRQTMLFSATMPGEVVTLARRHLSRPTHVRAEQHDEPSYVPSTEQHVFRAHQMDKIEVLARVLQAEGRGLTIVFCRTKRACDQVATALTTRGFAAAPVHGDLGQGQRERAMRAFRSGKVDVLVATDVAARGLDVDDVTHVVNYECPEDDKAYLHRTGRTGRAGRDRRGRDVRGLGRHAALEAHQRHPRSRPARAGRDLLHVPASVRCAPDPGGCHRYAAQGHARPAGLGGRGPRGHRGDRPQPLASGTRRQEQRRPGPGRTGARAPGTARPGRAGSGSVTAPGAGWPSAMAAVSRGARRLRPLRAGNAPGDEGGHQAARRRKRRPSRRRGARGGTGQATQPRPASNRPDLGPGH